MKLKSVFLTCASVAICAAVTGNATAATGNVVVKASIASGCTITSVGELDFGPLDQSSNSVATATGAILYWCTKDTPYTIALGNGENYNPAAAKRQMKQAGGAALLPYHLESNKEGGIGNGPASNESLTLSGTILGPDVQNAVAANYLDNVIVTIEP